MSFDRAAKAEAKSPTRHEALRRLVVAAALAALPAALAAGDSAPSLDALARGPLLTLEASNAEGVVRLELSPSDYTIEDDTLSWSSTEPIVLRDPGSGREIAVVQELSVVYVADPQIGLSFSVLAGGLPTNFLFSVGGLTFDPIDDATGRATASFTITDVNGDGAVLTGQSGDGQPYQAFYNETPGVPGSGSSFATLGSNLSTEAYRSATFAEDFPAAPVFSPTSESGAVLGAVSSLAAEVRFQLSAGDAASGATLMVIPEPDLPAESMAIRLGAEAGGAAAEVELSLSPRRFEEGAVVWSSPEAAVLRDPDSGAEIGRLEADLELRVADHTLSLNFSVVNLGAVPGNFVLSSPSFGVGAVPDAFARATAAITILDLDGLNAALTGTNADGQAYEAFYNDVGGVPGTGATFATLRGGLTVATPYSSAAGSDELGAAGAFSAQSEAGATLGLVSSVSARWTFQIESGDVATGTSVFALHPGGNVSGRVYLDTDGSGAQDPGEPGLAGVAIAITDSQAGAHATVTDGNGDYAAAVPAGSATVDVDETTLPAGAIQTEGSDPTIVAVPAGGTVVDVDGYQVQGLVRARVFFDSNANGAEDPGEPGLAGVDVEVTDSVLAVQTITTDANGDASAVVAAGSTTLDVDDATLPPDLVLSVGSDPAVVLVPGGGEASARFGYRAFSLVEIPTLGGLGLSLLALGLGLAGARRLARRRPRQG